MSYPDLSDLQRSSYFATAPSVPTQSNVPSAPFTEARAVQPQQTRKTYVLSGAEKHTKIDTLTCAVCDKHLSERKTDSVVLFGVCNHSAHLACLVPLLRAGARNVDGGEDSLCSRCASDALARDDARRGAPHANRVYRDPEELLTNFKAVYRKENPQLGMTYEDLKNEPLDVPHQRELLRAPPASSLSGVRSAFSSSALMTAATSFVKRARGEENLVASADAHEDDEADKITKMLEEGLFAECAHTLGRTYDDMISSENGSLLAVYRAGVRTLNDLCYIGFDPMRHLSAEYRAKAPAWQLVDLYGLTFADLVRRERDNGMGMTVRTLAEYTALRPSEWALLGADAQTMLSLGMTLRDVKRINMRLDRWQRYLLLERAHLSALGITTRHVFVHELKWDKNHEWCP